MNFLVARGGLEPKIALALTCFRAQWNEPLLLKSGLAACEDNIEKEATAGLVYHYMTLDQVSVSKWRKLKSVFTEYGMAVPSDLDERVALSEREEQSRKSGENSHGIDRAADRKGKLDLSRRESLLKGGESGPAIVPGKGDPGHRPGGDRGRHQLDERLKGLASHPWVPIRWVCLSSTQRRAGEPASSSWVKCASQRSSAGAP